MLLYLHQEVTITESNLEVCFQDGDCVDCSSGSDEPQQCNGAFLQTEIGNYVLFQNLAKYIIDKCIV